MTLTFRGQRPARLDPIDVRLPVGCRICRLRSRFRRAIDATRQRTCADNRYPFRRYNCAGRNASSARSPNAPPSSDGPSSPSLGRPDNSWPVSHLEGVSREAGSTIFRSSVGHTPVLDWRPSPMQSISVMPEFALTQNRQECQSRPKKFGTSDFSAGPATMPQVLALAQHGVAGAQQRLVFLLPDRVHRRHDMAHDCGNGRTRSSARLPGPALGRH